MPPRSVFTEARGREHTHTIFTEAREREHAHTHTQYLQRREGESTRTHTHTAYILQKKRTRTHTHTAIINRKSSMQSACASPPRPLGYFGCEGLNGVCPSITNHFNHCCVSCAAVPKQSICKMSVHGLTSCATIDASHKAKWYIERARTHTHHT